MRDAFAPVGVVIDLWKERVGRSARPPVPVMVINDLETPWTGEVTLRMEKDGKTAWQKTKEAKVNAFGAGTTDFQVQFPEAPAKCELIAGIPGHEGEPVRSCRVLRVEVSGD